MSSLLRRIWLCAGVFAAAAPAIGQDAPPRIDQAFINANIYTMDPSRPRAEALGLLRDKIVYVGSDRVLLEAARKYHAKVHDLAGRTVLPGLIDAHGHMGGLGSFGLGRLDLSRAASFDDVVAIVAERVQTAKKGEWILGGRWDHESWPDRKLPSHQKLSAVSEHNPVWITRVGGNAGLANEAAMVIANVTRETRAPVGGDVLKGRGGEPTGLFVNNGMDLITRHIDGAVASAEELILEAQQMCLAVGLTGVHDAGISPSEAQVYRELERSGRLKIRVYGMLSAPYAIAYFASKRTYIRDRFTLRACKLYADGAMGSRGAWLLAPYADRPTDDDGEPYTGLAVSEPESIARIAQAALAREFQVCTHAIGDRANREVLNAYAEALAQRPGQDHRFRIEHAQLLSLDDISRFAELGVIPSMQPTHCTTDMRWVDARIGPDRAKGAYAWASLLRTGVRIAAGSDFPVESHNPFLGIYAAVTRQDRAGSPPGGWHPEQRMTRTEILRAFTLDAAYAAFEERKKGSLTPYKFADFIVLDRDVMTCEPQQIIETRILRTVIGGETVYEKP